MHRGVVGHPLMQVRDFHDAPVGIALVGVDGEDRGRIVRANHTLGALVGTRPETLAGSLFCDLVHAQDRQYAAEEFAGLVDRAWGACEGEGRLVAANGRTRWVRIHAAMFPADGVARAVVMVRVIQIAELSRLPDTSAP